MGAGTFNKQVGKVRPGTYVNFENVRLDVVNLSERGTMVIPLDLNWGPVKEFVTLTCGTPDGEIDKVGYSIYEDDPTGCSLLLRESFKQATKVIFYRLTGGEKATVKIDDLTVNAKYEGTRGNDIRVVIEENPLGGMDVSVYLDVLNVFLQEGVSTIEELEESDYVDWSGEKESVLTETAGTVLVGGTNTARTNYDITTFLDQSELVKFKSLCFPSEDATLQTALKTKIR